MFITDAYQIMLTLRRAVNEHKAIEINYRNNKGEISTRILSRISFAGREYKSEEAYIRAYCHLRNEERTFFSVNIKGIKILDYTPYIEEHNNVHQQYNNISNKYQIYNIPKNNFDNKSRTYQEEKPKPLNEVYIKTVIAIAKRENKPVEIVYPSSSSFENKTHIIQGVKIIERDNKKYIKTKSDTFYLFDNLISIKIHGFFDFSDEIQEYMDSISKPKSNVEVESYNVINNVIIDNTDKFPQEYLEVINLVENTNNNVFITGGAGTGKSTLLKYIVEHTQKKCVVLAPTGIAAINANGQTIHSFFRFPITLFDKKTIKVDSIKKELFESLQMMIIDEISMVRVDILDAVDWALRVNRRNSKPFGGVQMIFVGDVFQLPPVLTAQDNEYIFTNYKSHYFFDAPVLQETDYQLKELTYIFRQDASEREFKETLNRIRMGKTTDDDIKLLNSRITNITDDNDTINLTTRREIATDINSKKLNKLPASSKIYKGLIIDTFDTDDSNKLNEDKLPAPYELELKIGAQIMLLRNDKSGRWVNGTIGIIQELNETSISVLINGKLHIVEKETWEQIEYKYNVTDNKIEKQIIGKYVQYPLQLAYAITIHKSQGMTFDKINIDIGQGAFTHGQIYVALSRCRTLNGIKLNSRIDETDIIVDPKVLYWYKSKINPDYEPNNNELQRAELEKMFEAELNEKIDIMDKQYNYQPSILKKMVSQLGVRNAIRKLVNTPDPPKGLQILKSKGALHLSMEALILDDKWKDLFEEIDKENARKRLRQLGFDYRHPSS